MSNFLINKVRVKNFRGYTDQEFDFSVDGKAKRGIIILGGSNGYGKTTLIDAIEWCLTGTIKRLRNNFIHRRENTLEMQRGLLRNSNVNKDEEVSVIVEGVFNDNPIVLKRTFNQKAEGKGLLPPDTYFEIIFDNKSIIGEVIDDVLGIPLSNRFYDRYICSYEKNIHIYEKNRRDLYQMFASFFGGLEDIETIIDNLDGYKRVEGKNKIQYSGLINELSSEIKSLAAYRDDLQLKYVDAQKELKQASEMKYSDRRLTEIFNVPPRVFEGELTTDEIRKQAEDFEQMYKEVKIHVDKFREIKDALIYGQIQQKCKDYNTILTEQLQLEEFKKYVLSPFLEKRDIIMIVQEYYSIHGDVTEKIKEINNFIDTFYESNNSISNDIFFLTKYEEKVFKGNISPHSGAVLKSHTDERAHISNQLKKYGDNREPIVQSLRAIVDHLSAYEELRKQGIESCPLCGSSEHFKSSCLGKQAKQLLGNIDEERAELQKRYNEIEERIASRTNEYKEKLLDESYRELDTLRGLVDYFDQINNLKVACSKFGFDIYKVNEDQLIEYERRLEDKVSDLNITQEVEYQIIQSLTSDSGILKGIPSLIEKDRWMDKDEFFVLETRKKKESIVRLITFYNKQLKKIKEINLVYNLEELSIGSIEQRIDIFENFKNELEIKQNFSNAGVLLKNIQNDIGENNKKLKDKKEKLNQLKSLREHIKLIKSQYDKKVAEQINTPLKKVYRKLNRHTNIEIINLSKEGKLNPKVNLSAKVNNKKLHVSNILSAGQLSIVSLSIFLTIAMGQKEEPFKCYFMDDPIQTMDDINILSLIDLIRAELAPNSIRNNRFMDQLFITTCNEDFEKLLSHKMRSFNVNVTHLHFTSYGEYKYINELHEI